MTTGTGTATGVVLNPYPLAGSAATVEIEGLEQGVPVADKYSVGTSSAAFTDLSDSPELFTTLDRMKAFDEEECDEDKPSAFAFETAVSVLTQAARFLKGEFPRGSASVGGGQGLRLTWRLPKGEIRLIVDGKKASKSYIYVELQQAESYIERTVSGDKLAATILKVFS